MPLYFLCPSTDIKETLWFLESNEVKVDWILCSMTRDCIESALAVHRRIPGFVVPLPTDMLLERGSPKRESPIVLQNDYPDMVFTGRGEVCDIMVPTETAEQFERRIKTAVECIKTVDNTVLVVARPSVIHAYAGVKVHPGHYHKMD